MMTCCQNERVTEWDARVCKPLIVLVGAAGFEPAAPCSQSRCSTRLSYAPSRNLRGLSSSFLTSWKWTRREQSDNTDTTPEICRTVRSPSPQRAEHLARWRAPIQRWLRCYPAAWANRGTAGVVGAKLSARAIDQASAMRASPAPDNNSPGSRKR